MSIVFDFCVQRLAPQPTREIAYAWDDWLCTDYFYFSTIPEFESVMQVSGLGNRALCIAIGEWICAELRQTPRHRDSLGFFDAAWVTMIQRHTCEYVVLEQEDWMGPLLGPLRAAMLIVNDTVFDAEEDFRFPDRSCWAINLARHIAEPERRGIFESWLQDVLERLASHHGPDRTMTAGSIFDRHFYFGAPVAPSLFVTDSPYDSSAAVAEITDHAEARRGTNPYLRLR
jgi:hypothetical protein